jgi:hypothetical protein
MRELTEEEYRLFNERVARGLAERPLTISPREHKERVAELLKQLGEGTFYHLLGIDPATGAREVHEAYDRVARLVHPSHGSRVGLEGREEVLKLLFERATLGYLTLADIDQRKKYDREVGPERWTALQTSTAAREEEARRFLARARGLAEEDDLETAVELLRKSVGQAPNAEAYGLLGLLLARNPQSLGEALESLERAEEMGSTEPGLPEALKEVREKVGQGGVIPFRKKRN